MHIHDYTIGGSYDCDQISNIYQYIEINWMGNIGRKEK
jgi:hypothetical protein